MDSGKATSIMIFLMGHALAEPGARPDMAAFGGATNVEVRAEANPERHQTAVGVSLCPSNRQGILHFSASKMIPKWSFRPLR
jgi:hypothetical protein